MTRGGYHLLTYDRIAVDEFQTKTRIRAARALQPNITDNALTKPPGVPEEELTTPGLCNCLRRDPFFLAVAIQRTLSLWVPQVRRKALGFKVCTTWNIRSPTVVCTSEILTRNSGVAQTRSDRQAISTCPDYDGIDERITESSFQVSVAPGSGRCIAGALVKPR